MMRILKISIIVGIVFFILDSCAYRHHPIKLSNLEYEKNTVSPGRCMISCSIDDSILMKANSRLLKKTSKKGLYLLPVRVENLTPDTINFQDLKIEVFVDYQVVPLVKPSSYYKKIRQNEWIHLGYSALGIVGSFTLSNGRVNYNYRSPLQVITPYGIYRYTVARKSNKQLHNDIQLLDIHGAYFYPGTVSYHLMCIKTRVNNDIHIRVNHEK